MSENNPLDDDLLRELGLEPREAPRTKPAAPTPAPPVTAGGSRSPKGGAQSAHDDVAVTAVPPVERGSRPQPAKQTPNQSFRQGVEQLTQDMPVQVIAVLGKKHMTLKDVLDLKQGEYIELKKMPQDLIDLVANGKLIARGELVLIEGKIGIQIKQIMAP